MNNCQVDHLKEPFIICREDCQWRQVGKCGGGTWCKWIEPTQTVLQNVTAPVRNKRYQHRHNTERTACYLLELGRMCVIWSWRYTSTAASYCMQKLWQQFELIISTEIDITGTAGYVAIVTKLRLTPKLHILHTDVEIKITCGLTVCVVSVLFCGLFILFFTI